MRALHEQTMKIKIVWNWNKLMFFSICSPQILSQSAATTQIHYRYEKRKQHVQKRERLSQEDK